MSGAERVVQKLAELMVMRGNHAVVITGQPDGGRQTREVNGVRVIYTPIKNIYAPLTKESEAASALRKGIWHLRDSYNSAMASELSELIKVENPDVVNTHNLMGFSSAAIKAAKINHIPVVHTIHDQYLLCPRSTMFKNGHNCHKQCAVCRIYALPRKVSTNHINAVIGVSQFILDRHIKFGYFPGATRHVIYNGIQIKELVPRQFFATERPFRFGFLGQIRQTKGLEQLVDAFIALRKPGIELHIGGRGDLEYEKKLKRKAEYHASIRWCGHVNASSFLRSIDVLVVPSLWHDTAPLVLIEALKEGTPVLASNRGGIPEFVSENTGWLYSPDRSQGLSCAMEKCVNSVSELLNFSRAAQILAKQFDEAKFVDGYDTIFRELSVRNATRDVLHTGLKNESNVR